MNKTMLPDVIEVDRINKVELAKNGIPHPKNPDVVQISKCQYVILNIPGNVIINTSRAFKTAEENKPSLEFLSRLLTRKIFEQELKKQGIDINDLSQEDWETF